MSRRPLDHYPTPTLLAQALLGIVGEIGGMVLEPCAGDGRLAESLRGSPAVRQVVTNDINPAHGADLTQDASDAQASMWAVPFEWMVTNPPYNQAAAILANAFKAARVGVAFLLRLSFLEPTNGRRAWLQAHAGELSHLLVFGSPRPSFTDNGRTDSATVAWMVWQRDWRGGTAVRFVTDWNQRPGAQEV